MTILQSLRDELQSKPVLRAGVGLIVALALAYAYGFANQTRNRSAQAYLADVAELQKVKLLAQQKDWPQRAKSALALQSGLQAAIPLPHPECGNRACCLAELACRAGTSMSQDLVSLRFE